MTDSELHSFGIRDTRDPITEAMKIINKGLKMSLSEDDFTMAEIITEIAKIADAVAPLGAGNLTNSLLGLEQTFSDQDSITGIMRVMGYSQRQAEERTKD